MIPKMDIALNDFSGGQVNADAKRSNDPIAQSGARVMTNMRILHSRKAANRPGRTAICPAIGRTDEVLVAPAMTFFLSFGDGALIIRDSSGAYVTGNTGYAWTAATAKAINLAVVKRSATLRDVVIFFNGTRPKIARWSSTAGWSFLDFSFDTVSSGARQTVFYRLAPPGITLTPSGITSQAGSAITLLASDDYFDAGMVGTIMRWQNHQFILTAVTDTKNAAGITIEQFPVTTRIDVTATSLQGTFSFGEQVSSTTPGFTTYNGVVANVIKDATGAVIALSVAMLQSAQRFGAGNVIVGPNGSFTALKITAITAGASLVWDEEVMTDFRGWPSSGFSDLNRLGLCDIPAVPSGIAWSEIGVYSTFLVGANPSDAMFEIVPEGAHVYNVVSKGDEFVLTDRGVWYIPISETNPLKPGSVVFKGFSADHVSAVKPVVTSDAVLYLNAALNRIVAIVTNQQSLTVPWRSQDVSLYHYDLFNDPIALAVMTDGSQLPEPYLFILNADGSMVVGKFDDGKEWVGFVPWTGTGDVQWVSSLGGDLTLTVAYDADATVRIVEQLDSGQLLDAVVPINDVPTAMQAGSDPTISTLVTGTASTVNMTSFAPAAAAFDGVALKNKAASVGDSTPNNGYNNVVWLHLDQGAQKLSSARITAPVDQPLSVNGSTTFEIVGSHTGIGTGTVVYTSGTTPGNNGEQITVASGIDQTTAYEYYGINLFGAAGKALAVALIEFNYLAPGATHQAPGGGTGPMWWLAGGQADVLDGERPLGTHAIDASGNVTPIDGEDLSAETIVAGLAWNATYEPFIPQAQPGQDAQQRMRRRRVAKALVSVQDSTGFVFDGRRVPPYNVGDNPNDAPPKREGSYQFRPRGRSYDPRKALVKDTPGTLTIIEIGLEVTA